MAFNAEKVVQIATQMRCDIVSMIAAAGSGHPGGSLSATDIMATLYFGEVLNYRADDPGWDKRDRFILSKGHAAPVLYAVLAQAGYLERAELLSLRKFGSRLQGHPDSQKLPGVEVSTGSLGQGLSIAAGLAAGLALTTAQDGSPALEPVAAQDDSTGLTCDAAQGNPTGLAPDAAQATPYVYVLLGDGELQEGQVWEAAMFAAHNRLSNIIAIVDSNNLQIDGKVSEVNDTFCIEDKFRAFNWRVISCSNGNDVVEVKRVLDEAKQRSLTEEAAPTVVVAKTVKGKGVCFMENQCGWHGKAPSAEQCAAALDELGA